ncbi:hypothetical protein M514_14854 [Trichuris suis]|uniref:Sm domain-containing protein n=1 Tax=Trichuris suis TaxID=68888 RepID=A0A085NU04_9BILA|nr:hypothetical protein M514_14854 [Trichuris suis]
MPTSGGLWGLLQKYLYVQLPDERVVIGRFVCVDRDCNLVLSECTEYSAQESPNGNQTNGIVMEKTRFLNFGHVPGRHIVKLKVLAEDARCLLDRLLPESM